MSGEPVGGEPQKLDYATPATPRPPSFWSPQPPLSANEWGFAAATGATILLLAAPCLPGLAVLLAVPVFAAGRAAVAVSRGRPSIRGWFAMIVSGLVFAVGVNLLVLHLLR